MEEVLGGVGTGVGAEQDRGLTGVEFERLAPADVLAARRVEALDRRAVVGAADPVVRGTELERGQFRLLLDEVERGEHLAGVDTVADRGGDDRHGEASWTLGALEACSGPARTASAPPPNFGRAIGGMYVAGRELRSCR
jgi:hypothetical protein